MGYQALGVALCVLGLQGVYRLIESSWPDSYMSLADLASYRKTTHPIGYMLFRFGPVFATSLFLAVSLDRGGQPVWPAGLATLGLHVATTHGRAARTVWPRTTDPRRSPLIALHVLASAALVTVGIAAIVLRDPLAPLIPPLDSLAGELWGAAIAGASVAYVFTQVGPRVVDHVSMVHAARAGVGLELLTFARSEAKKCGTDPDLVEAILLTESVQRPRWFRVLERLKSWVLRDGTYGVMQVRHRGAVSDKESVRIALADFLSDQQLPMAARGGYSCLDVEALRSQLRPYNRSDAWFEMVTTFLHVIQSERRGDR